MTVEFGVDSSPISGEILGGVARVKSDMKFERLYLIIL